MIIWEYYSDTKIYGRRTFYGTPVEVFLPGMGYTQVVYQFHPAAVVHHASGRVIAKIEGGRGALQEQARNAVALRMEAARRSYPTAAQFHESVRRVVDDADTINPTVEVVPFVV